MLRLGSRSCGKLLIIEGAVPAHLRVNQISVLAEDKLTVSSHSVRYIHDPRTERGFPFYVTAS